MKNNSVKIETKLFDNYIIMKRRYDGKHASMHMRLTTFTLNKT